MVLELSALLRKPVKTVQSQLLGSVDAFAIDGDRLHLAGFQILKKGLLKKFSALAIDDVVSLSRDAVVVDSQSDLSEEMKPFDEINHRYGRVIGVAAKTESGKQLGRVSDLLIEAETGLVIRFYLRRVLTERIIPRQFVVSVSPRQVVFKDIVDTPIFDQLATSDATA